MPPLFGSYRADLFKADKVSELATPLIRALSPHVDIWLAETISLIAEPLALKVLLPEDGKPFWISFTLEDEVPGCEPALRPASGWPMLLLRWLRSGSMPS